MICGLYVVTIILFLISFNWSPIISYKALFFFFLLWFTVGVGGSKRKASWLWLVSIIITITVLLLLLAFVCLRVGPQPPLSSGAFLC